VAGPRPAPLTAHHYGPLNSTNTSRLWHSVYRPTARSEASRDHSRDHDGAAGEILGPDGELLCGLSRGDTHWRWQARGVGCCRVKASRARKDGAVPVRHRRSGGRSRQGVLPVPYWRPWCWRRSWFRSSRDTRAVAAPPVRVSWDARTSRYEGVAVGLAHVPMSRGVLDLAHSTQRVVVDREKARPGSGLIRLGRSGRRGCRVGV